MALETETAWRACLQPITVRRLVWIVARGTKAETHRSMDDLLNIETPLMTEIAKLALLPRHFEAVFSGVVHGLFLNWHMTTDTFACSHGTVHIPLLFEVVVTVKTRSFLRRGCVAYPTRQQRP